MLNNTIYLLFLIIVFSGCSGTTKFTGEDNLHTKRTKNTSFSKNYTNKNDLPIRVLLNNKAKSYKLKLLDKSQLVIDGSVKMELEGNSNVEIYVEENQLNVNAANRNFNGEKIAFNSSGIFMLEGKKYRGDFLSSISGGRLKIVNRLNLDDYLKGVLPMEMPIGSGNENYEALKAFAITARNYSLSKIVENKIDYDVYPDVRDQVYGGVDAEKDITNSAVDETSGMIIKYNNQPAITFYHASCGGYTENIANVFGSLEYPYLKGIKDGDPPNCSIAPNFYWKENFSESALIRNLFKAKKIKSRDYSVENIRINKNSTTGRVKEIIIDLSSDDNDEEVIIKGNDIRSVIGNSNGSGILKSTMFNAEFDGENFILNGQGNGHGVGLCQWGAISLSQKGYSFKDIIYHYFPGTQLGTL